MQTPEEVKQVLSRFNLNEREEVLDMLESSISMEYQQMAALALQADLEICRERLERYDAGQSQAKPFDQVIQNVFGDK